MCIERDSSETKRTETSLLAKGNTWQLSGITQSADGLYHAKKDAIIAAHAVESFRALLRIEKLLEALVENTKPSRRRKPQK